MKSISAVLLSAVLSTLNFSSLAAQVPAFGALRASAPQRFELVMPPAASVAAPYSPYALKTALSGEQLFSYLHETTAFSRAGYQPSYKGSKAYMYSTADNSGCDGVPGILTFYSQVCVKGSSNNGENYKEQGDANNDGVVDTFINAEHLWPQSYFNSALPMVADLHHLQSTFATPNGRRGNLPFAKVAKATYRTSSGSKLGSEGFEPADAVKGNVARAMFYFIVRYSDKNIKQGMNYNSFWTSRVNMLMEWNRQDPPDANELRRNGLVEKFQGNRNPFIDNPELVDQIGEQVFKAH